MTDVTGRRKRWRGIRTGRLEETTEVRARGVTESADWCARVCECVCVCVRLLLVRRLDGGQESVRLGVFR